MVVLVFCTSHTERHCPLKVSVPVCHAQASIGISGIRLFGVYLADVGAFGNVDPQTDVTNFDILRVCGASCKSLMTTAIP